GEPRRSSGGDESRYPTAEGTNESNLRGPECLTKPWRFVHTTTATKSSRSINFPFLWSSPELHSTLRSGLGTS
ncbi:hypothetical protein VIGAN_UM009300, partial [Vigna angularis var. angularis]